MQKKYGILCVVVMCVVGIFVAAEIKKPMPQKSGPVVIRRELPITTKNVKLGQNRYGDYLAGIIAQQNQDYAKMANYYEKALNDDKDNIKIKTTLYLLRLIGGRVDEAVPLAEELQKLKQGQLLTEYVLSADAVQKKEYDKVSALLKNKAKYGLDPVLIPMIKGWMLADQGKIKEADDTFKNVPTSKALFAYYRALLAVKAGTMKDAEARIAEFKKLSPKGFPSLTAVLFLRDFGASKQEAEQLLGQSVVVKGALDTILPPKAITAELGIAVGFYDVSVALAPLKSKEAALAFNALAMKLAPDMTIPKIWGAELLEGNQNYQAANRLYRSISPENDVIMVKMIVNEMAEEKYEAALPIAQKLLERNQKNASVFAVAGDIYAKLKNHQKAIECYEKARDLFLEKGEKENAGNTCIGLATVYEEMGNEAEKVEAHLQDALKLVPDNPLALNFLGYVWLEKNKNVNQAFAMVQKAHQLLPKEAEIMDSLAFGYYVKQEYDKALPLAEKAIDLLPFSSVAYGHLGDIYQALGQKRNAKYQYQKALALHKDITPKLKSELEEKLKACQN